MGLTLLHFVSEFLIVAPAIIVGNTNFVRKTVFPLEILPASAMGTTVVHLQICTALTLIAVLLAAVSFTAAILWLPLIVLPMRR